MTAERYMMAQDNDCHWYVIPVARQQEWYDWCDIPTDDERSWEPPEFAQRTYGSYSLVTFADPVIA